MATAVEILREKSDNRTFASLTSIQKRKFPEAIVTEIRYYTCTCDKSARFTEKELKIHIKLHKDARDRVVFEPWGGLSFEM